MIHRVVPVAASRISGAAQGLLELPLQSGRDSHDRCARPTLRSGVDAAGRGIGVVAIGSDRPTAGAEIVMGVGAVDGRRHARVPSQVRRVYVLVRQCQVVGQFEIGT